MLAQQQLLEQQERARSLAALPRPPQLCEVSGHAPQNVRKPKARHARRNRHQFVAAPHDGAEPQMQHLRSSATMYARGVAEHKSKGWVKNEDHTFAGIPTGVPMTRGHLMCVLSVGKRLGLYSSSEAEQALPESRRHRRQHRQRSAPRGDEHPTVAPLRALLEEAYSGGLPSYLETALSTKPRRAAKPPRPLQLTHDEVPVTLTVDAPAMPQSVPVRAKAMRSLQFVLDPPERTDQDSERTDGTEESATHAVRGQNSMMFASPDSAPPLISQPTPAKGDPYERRFPVAVRTRA